MNFRPFVLAAALLGLALPAFADPLSRSVDIDFFRDVPSRNLHGLATRSDGRLLAGPVITDLAGEELDDLLWSLEPAADGKWLVGSGPNGKIFEVTVNAQKNAYQARRVAQLKDSHVFALRRLADGTLLAGTSPKGGLYLLRDDKVVTRIKLPVDSIYDLAVINADTVLVATGNPGRIYRVDLKKFAAAGVISDEDSPAAFEKAGISLFGEIRDRNVRRLVSLKDGRVIAGSSPKGNVYSFNAAGGSPLILLENKEAEVTDLLPADDSSFYASIVFSTTLSTAALDSDKNEKEKHDKTDEHEEPSGEDDTAIEPFDGRSILVSFPKNGFPEGALARDKQAFYRLARQGNLILISGGEQGDMLAYDPVERMTLSFPGSSSAQVLSLAPLSDQAGRYLLLRNNVPGLGLLDFIAGGVRTAETRRIDLKGLGTLGNLRFDRLRDISTAQIKLEMKASSGTDELEGWGDWTTLKAGDDAWKADALRGRSIKLRVTVPADAKPSLQIDRADLFLLPQNRRPQLQEFHIVSPNYAISPNVVSATSSNVTTLGQLLTHKSEDAGTDDPKKDALHSSQVFPRPGMQLVVWSVTDPDGDNLVYTYSIRREDSDQWTDLAVDTADSYVQFDTSHLADGIYFTRLVAKETAPRASQDRLSVTFEIDDLTVDHTPPDILAATAKRENGQLIISVQGRDALSLLAGADFNLNNGVSESVEQPADGILDGREETFILSLPLARASGATSVELTLYDAAGNTKVQRIALPSQ